VQRAFLFGAV